jgi:tetratricopeptide (TPR) repeat protein
MDSEIIELLNKFENDRDEQLKQLVECHKLGKLTLVNIIAHKQYGLKFHHRALCDLALKIHNGEDAIQSNIDAARLIFTVASSFGSKLAKWHLVLSFLNFAPKNVKAAVDLFTELNKKENVLKATPEIMFRTGKAYFENERYSEAWNVFLKVSEKNGEQDNPQYQQAQEYLESIKKMARDKLAGMLNTSTSNTSPQDLDSIDDDNMQTDGVITSAASSSTVVATSASATTSSSSSATISATSISNIVEQKQDLSDELDGYSNATAFNPANDALKMAAENLSSAMRKRAQVQKNMGSAYDRADRVCKAAEDIYNDAKDKLNEIKTATEKKEIKRHVQTEKHFFAIERNKNTKAKESARHLLEQRQRAVTEIPIVPLVATNVPVRSLIAAEHAVIRASLLTFGSPNGYGSIAFPWTFVTNKPHNIWNQDRKAFVSYDQYYGHFEHVQLGDTTIIYQHRIDPHRNHVGDFHMKDIGTYREINDFFISLVSDASGINPLKEKQLAEWMLRYAKTGRHVELRDLQPMCENSNQEQVNKLMRIFYHCFVKEPARWMIPKDESNELPLATSHLRAVRLILHGSLHISEVFGEDSEYGVFTGKDIGSKLADLKEKIAKINKLYIENILLTDTTSKTAYSNFKEKFPGGNVVTKRSVLHQELVEDFGGGSDTDGEGYDSDTAEREYPSTYKF